MSNKITKALIFAAGLGTRLKPFTDFHPKALFKVNGKTLLERNIEYLKQYGIDDIIINVHHFADQIIQHAEANNNWGINISFSDERDSLLDTGGGLLKAAPFFKSTDNFLLYNADILTNLHLEGMMNFHLQHLPMVTLSVSERKSSRYFLFNHQDRLCGWENTLTGEQKIKNIQPDLQQRAFSGIHIVNKSLLSTKKSIEKCSITDWYLDICTHQNIMGYIDNEAKFIDVGKVESLPEAEKLFF